MRISDWSSDVCSSDLRPGRASRRAGRCRSAPRALLYHACRAEFFAARRNARDFARHHRPRTGAALMDRNELLAPFERLLETACPLATVRAIEGGGDAAGLWDAIEASRSEEHTSELQSLMSISYAVFCLQ